MRRAALLAGVAAAVVALSVPLAAPAGAVLTHDGLGCGATASVQTEGGKSIYVDGADAEVRLPRRGDVYWAGTVTKPAHRETGSLELRLGFWEVPVGTWGPSANPTDQLRREGSRPLPGFLRVVPPGRYVLTGTHRAAEGSCTGHLTVVVAGSAVSNLAAVAGAGLAALFGLGFVRAGRRSEKRKRGRPIAGAVYGALLGLTVCGVLVAELLVASDNVVVGALPLVLLAGGVVLGAVAPFGA